MEPLLVYMLCPGFPCGVQEALYTLVPELIWHSGHKKYETVSTLLLSALWKLNACCIIKNNFPLCALALFTLALLKNIGHTLKKDHAPWLCLLWELQTRLSQPAEHTHMGIPVWDRSCTAQWTEWTAAASLVLARVTVCDFCHLQGLVKALIHAWTTQAIWGRQLSLVRGSLFKFYQVQEDRFLLPTHSNILMISYQLFKVTYLFNLPKHNLTYS